MIWETYEENRDYYPEDIDNIPDDFKYSIFLILLSPFTLTQNEHTKSRLSDSTADT